jgi:UDP-N-acetylmuramyl tripeptide synthase
VVTTLPRPSLVPGATDALRPFRRLPLRIRVAAAAGRAAGAASRFSGRGRGSTIPGRVLLGMLPGGLHQLATDRTFALVSGTNGKTTTTRYLTTALAALGPVLSNSEGSNLHAGLATALLADRQRRKRMAVLEVDEAALPAAVRQLDPQVLVLLNLSRDQLDRFGEVAGHCKRWAAALAGTPRARVVANADDPLVAAAVLSARPGGHGVTWVAAGQPWRGDSALCPRCRQAWSVEPDWACDGCGLSRPQPSWELDEEFLLGPAGERLPLHLGLPGRANRANALLAAAAAADFGVPIREALARMGAVTDVGGRYSVRRYQGCAVRLLLAKNPAGWLEVLDQIQDDRSPLVLGVNARTADGGDPSWLWDVPFERLRGRRVMAAGERAADLSVRLLYAGVHHGTVTDPLDAITRLAASECTVVGNYTVFTSTRSALAL